MTGGRFAHGHVERSTGWPGLSIRELYDQKPECQPLDRPVHPEITGPRSVDGELRNSSDSIEDAAISP